MTLSLPQTATPLFCLTSEVELKDALWQALLNPGGLDVGVGGRAVHVGRLPVVGLEYQVVALVLLGCAAVSVGPTVGSTEGSFKVDITCTSLVNLGVWY